MLPVVWGESESPGGTDVMLEEGAAVSGIDVEMERAAALIGEVDLSVLNPAGLGACVGVTAWRRSGNGWTEAGFTRMATTGSYAVRGLPGGTYRLGFANACTEYQWGQNLVARQFFPDALRIKDAVDLHVGDGAEVDVDTVTLGLNAQVDGQLFIDRKAGRAYAKKVPVRVYRPVGSGWQLVTEVRSDKHGSYRIPHLRAGDYRFGFGHGIKRVRTTYYPDALTLAKAKTVTIKPHYSDHHSLGTTIVVKPGAKVRFHANSPRVRGAKRVGRKVQTYRMYVTPDHAKVRYQWQVRRNGKVRAIPGATQRHLRLRKAQRGAQVRVRVVATAFAHQRDVAVSKWSKKVR